ncbi:hypothetical protein FBU30_007936 [Linnemannia zychae]|nr:hypothetical protein FBU30_007936 [Linnemannia zychae]
MVFDFAFHPTLDIIATGLITGHINCVKYAPGAGNNEVAWSIRPTKKSCRGLAFSSDGAGLFSVFKDGAIRALDVNTGDVLIKKSDAHDTPINTVKLLTETTLATGDDSGVIKLWDVRTGNETMQYTEHNDFISDFDYDVDSKTLVASSGQGTISIYDIRKPKMLAMSANQDDELMSICIVKDRRKVVVGSQEGVLNIYSWGEWGDCTDRFIGHPNSVDTICKIDEDTVATGSSDGIIRIIDILPNKFQGIVGEHEDFPIERIKLSHDKTFLASCSHDDTVRFWDVRYLTSDRDDEEEEDDSDDEKDNDKSGKNGGSMDVDSDDSDAPKKSNNRRPKKQAPAANNPGFFDDLNGIRHGKEPHAYLLSQGTRLNVWNRSVSKTDALRNEGAHIVASIQELAASSNIIFTSLSNDAAVESVYEQLIQHAATTQEPIIFVKTSTIHPSVATKNVELLSAYSQHAYLQCPVFGRPERALTGQLVWVTSGNSTALEKVKPYIGSMAKGTIDLNTTDVSKASSFKLLGNFFVADSIELLAEGLALAEKVDLLQKTVLELIHGLFGSPAGSVTAH